MGAVTRVAVVTLALLSLVRGEAAATASGIFDRARPGPAQGCGCHGLPQTSNVITQLVIDGLPASYVPGTAYDLTVWVLGVPIPSIPLGSALRGFNLDVTAGKLDAVDPTVQTVVQTECQIRKSMGACTLGTTCGVNGPELCSSNDECFTRKCTTIGGTCRLCSAVNVNIQATHTSEGGAAPAPVNSYFGDGNSVLNWPIKWTAPNPGAGPVTFYLAGNVVNSSGGPDLGDVWSVLNPGLVVPQAP
jgi:hypothetical protein